MAERAVVREAKPPVFLFRLFLAVMLLAGFTLAAHADRLDEIKARGSLIVGVKTDYEPFGFRNAAGETVGYDVDVAEGLAESLGVKLVLVPVTSANRLQKLVAGEIDAVVATLGDTVDRRRLVRMIEPGYYGGGASVLLPEQSPIRTWTDLRNRDLCAVQGALWNRLIATRLNARIEAFGSIRDAELALRDGACDGWLYDEAALQRQIASGDWPGFRLLPPDFVSPWAVAVASDGRLATEMDETIASWLRDGSLAALEAKWKLPPSVYLRDAGKLWTARDPDGRFTCRRQEDGSWTLACRELDLIEAQEVVGLAGFTLMLRDRFGIDVTPFYDRYHRAGLIEGLQVTLALAVAVLVGSIGIGLGGAFVLRRRVPLLTPLIHLLLTLMRMTPPLLQLYLVFFGIGGLVAVHGLTLSAFWCAVAVLSFYAGAANAAALAEAAATIGTAPQHRLKRALRLAHPAIMGSSINVVKATAMASAIAVPELVHASTAIAADYGNGPVMMNILLVVYVVIVLAVAHFFTLFERRVLAK
ncbi:polar amino acid transport system substrate-binding protein [Kaistia soli DSM 19436]|uniref:Polar amino acid transport system substrate-binding protein n=1 Tax=Kaistia soli DSM 19436 TaxID=1122133 RepID=A0A1M4WU95_9HYPH|nr:ABC transporter permease subunit [Kaistia soli]SHE84829.1 polar amino acid transport system substrate-binding protein [Kaistia soli DSM 19436]